MNKERVGKVETKTAPETERIDEREFGAMVLDAASGAEGDAAIRFEQEESSNRTLDEAVFDLSKKRAQIEHWMKQCSIILIYEKLSALHRNILRK